MTNGELVSLIKSLFANVERIDYLKKCDGYNNMTEFEKGCLNGERFAYCLIAEKLEHYREKKV